MKKQRPIHFFAWTFLVVYVAAFGMTPLSYSAHDVLPCSARVSMSVDRTIPRNDSVKSETDREIWLFNTRTASFSSPTSEEMKKIAVFRRTSASKNNAYRWEKSSLETLDETMNAEQQAHRNRDTVVLIHGNRFSYRDAWETGLQFDRLILGDSDARLILWSWYADEKILFPLRDARMKGRLSEVQGVYLGQLLERFPDRSRVCLVGFSFGARTICESLRRFSQDAMRNDAENRLEIRNLFLAPAIDQGQVFPASRYGTAFPLAEKTLVVYNPQDRALRLYPFLNGLCGPQALGRLGVATSILPPETRSKVELLNINRISGNRHEFRAYFDSSRVNRQLSDFVLFRN